MALASRSKRSENCAAETLIATTRFKRGSRARYTSPMPPAPMGARISYGPSFVPAKSAIGGVDSILWQSRLWLGGPAPAGQLIQAIHVCLGAGFDDVGGNPAAHHFQIALLQMHNRLAHGLRAAGDG